MRQLQLFTTIQLAEMRDRTKSRSYSPAADEFRRKHEVHRAWGITQRHAMKLLLARRAGRLTTLPGDTRPAHTEPPAPSSPSDQPAPAPPKKNQPATPAPPQAEQPATPAPPQTNQPAIPAPPQKSQSSLPEHDTLARSNSEGKGIRVADQGAEKTIRKATRPKLGGDTAHPQPLSPFRPAFCRWGRVWWPRGSMGARLQVRRQSAKIRCPDPGSLACAVVLRHDHPVRPGPGPPRRPHPPASPGARLALAAAHTPQPRIARPPRACDARPRMPATPTPASRRVRYRPDPPPGATSKKPSPRQPRHPISSPPRATAAGSFT